MSPVLQELQALMDEQLKAAGGVEVPPSSPPPRKNTRAEQARINGAKSKGPKTPRGKANSAQNAVKHGLLSAGLIFGCEDPAEYLQFEADFIRELRAVGTVQKFLARRAAMMAWKLERLPRIESGVLAMRRPDGREHDGSTLYDLGAELAGDDKDGALLRFQRYEQRIERSMRACLNELRTMQETYAVEETFVGVSTSANQSASASASATAGSASGVGGSPETSASRENEEHRSRSTATCGTGAGTGVGQSVGSGKSQPFVQPTYAELLGSFGQMSDNEAACVFHRAAPSDGTLAASA